ncbi:MAG TPA: hypothetical protein VGE33_06625 [Thermomonas sp.]
MPWSEPAAIAALAAGSLLLSVLCTRWAWGHARRRGLLDVPGERRSHALPTPRGGGIGIAAVGLVIFGLLGFWDGPAWVLAGAGLLLVAAVGWWDDHRPLPAWSRLLVHVLAGGCQAVALAWQGAPVPVAVVAGLLVPILVNIWNFIDGIDGIAVTQALLWTMALAWLTTGPTRWLAIGLAAACAGFLPFNFPKARIFLGDVGSGALGYLLASTTAAAMAVVPLERAPLLFLPASACLVDASLTLARRMARGERWWQPHVQHLYQRLARRFGHPPVTLGYAGWAASGVGLAWVLRDAGATVASCLAMAFAVLSAMAWAYLQRDGKGAG